MQPMFTVGVTKSEYDEAIKTVKDQHARIRDLEAQVNLLNEQARRYVATAIDRKILELNHETINGLKAQLTLKEEQIKGLIARALAAERLNASVDAALFPFRRTWTHHGLPRYETTPETTRRLVEHVTRKPKLQEVSETRFSDLQSKVDALTVKSEWLKRLVKELEEKEANWESKYDKVRKVLDPKGEFPEPSGDKCGVSLVELAGIVAARVRCLQDLCKDTAPVFKAARMFGDLYEQLKARGEGKWKTT